MASARVIYRFGFTTNSRPGPLPLMCGWYIRSTGMVTVDAARTVEERLYYWLDVHWTPAGNDAAAQAVFEYLSDRGAGAELDRASFDGPASDLSKKPEPG